MPRLIDSSYDYVETVQLPCGGTAHWIYAQDGYICADCLCKVGSIAQPAECVEARDKYTVLKELGSKVRWDYKAGKEVTLE